MGGAGNQQSSTTNCYRYGNSINCQQYARPQINPDGCGTAVGCAIQGYERGRQQAQQQQIQQERLEQLKLQNQQLQQQMEMQREQLELQRQEPSQRGAEIEEQGNSEPRPGGDEKQPEDVTYAPVTRTRVLEAEYCFGFGTAMFSTMQYRIHQTDMKSDTTDSTKSIEKYMLQHRTSDNEKLASYVVSNINLADDTSLRKFYNDGVTDYGKVISVMDHARKECLADSPAERPVCTIKITDREANRLGSNICNNFDFLTDRSGDQESGGN